MHILVGTDLSERSQAAFMRAVQLRRKSRDHLVLVHVVDGDQPAPIVDAQRERAQGWLTSQVHDAVDSNGIDVSILTGDPHTELLTAADACDAGLIVLGAHRQRRLKDAFIGTTAERLIRMSTRPVLIVHRPEPHPYRTVLAATDLSDNSIQALLVARQLNLLPNQSRIVHVFPTPAKGKLQQAGVDPAPHVEAMRVEAMRTLTGRLRQSGLESLLPRVVLRDGRVTHAIRRLVLDIEPDLLIVGTRGLDGLKRAVLGSVTEGLLRTVPCDVLVVPPAVND